MSKSVRTSTGTLERRPRRCIGRISDDAQALDDAAHAVGSHGQAAIHRHHDDIQPADLGVVRFRQFVVQVPEMADAETGDLEYEDRISVMLGATVAAANIRRDVADIGIADHQVDVGLFSRAHRSSRAARVQSLDPASAYNARNAPRFIVTTSGIARRQIPAAEIGRDCRCRPAFLMKKVECPRKVSFTVLVGCETAQ